MKKNVSNGQYTGKDASSSDLERGYSADDSMIPDDGENVFNPKSKDKYCMMYCRSDDPGFDGGFLGRDDHGMERY